MYQSMKNNLACESKIIHLNLSFMGVYVNLLSSPLKDFKDERSINTNRTIHTLTFDEQNLLGTERCFCQANYSTKS